MTRRLPHMMTWKNANRGHTPCRCREFACQVVIAIVVLALAPGCRPKSEANGAASGHITEAVGLDSIHSRRDLDGVLKRGMTTNEVLVRLGNSSDIMTLTDGMLEWTYWLHPFPAEGEMKGLYVVAARLSITNGRVEHVGYVYMSAPTVGTQVALSNGAHSNQLHGGSIQPCLLTLSVISSNRIVGGRFIDSQRFPQLGYVPMTPEVSIGKVRSVVIERHPPTQSNQLDFPGWSFVVYLTEEDSLLLQSFTGTNVSRRVLISVNNEPIAAPVVLTPIDTGSFVFDCTDRVVAERLERELTQMAKED